MEKLDINNILEAQEIKNLIRHKKNLLDFFDDMIQKINIQINDEKPVFKINIDFDDTIDDTIDYSTDSSLEVEVSPVSSPHRPSKRVDFPRHGVDA